MEIGKMRANASLFLNGQSVKVATSVGVSVATPLSLEFQSILASQYSIPIQARPGQSQAAN